MSPEDLTDDALITDLRDQLRTIAAQHFAAETQGHTLQPTAVANEVWVHMLGREDLSFENLTAFKAWAATAVRHILVDHARKKAALKRGGGLLRVPLPDVAEEQPVDLVELSEALDDLTRAHERSARVVEMRFFGGMTEDEIARELGVSDRTVRNDWRFARGWLHRAIVDDLDTTS